MNIQDMNLKQRLIIFTLVSYLLPALMAIPMYIAKNKGVDTTVFGYVQMLCPALGVIIGHLLYNTNNQISKFYVMYISIVIMFIALSISSIFINKDASTIFSYIILLVGSVSCYYLLKRSNDYELIENGLDLDLPIKMFRYVFLFTLLYTIEMILCHLVSNEMNILFKNVFRIDNIINILAILFSYFIGYLIYFGEEYGWRYFLQPILQQKFGNRLGLLVLGLVWGIWHAPLRLVESDSLSNGLIYMIGQIGACIALGIFFGYVYMKTKNIWIVSILHYTNNNLTVVS